MIDSSEQLVALLGALAGVSVLGVPVLDALHSPEVESWFRQRSANLWALILAFGGGAGVSINDLPTDARSWLETALSVGAAWFASRSVLEVAHTSTDKAAWRARLRQRAGILAPFVSTIAPKYVGQATPFPDLPELRTAQTISSRAQDRLRFRGGGVAQGGETTGLE